MTYTLFSRENAENPRFSAYLLSVYLALSLAHTCMLYHIGMVYGAYTSPSTASLCALVRAKRGICKYYVLVKFKNRVFMADSRDFSAYDQG